MEINTEYPKDTNWSSFTIRLKDFDNFENEIMTISMNEDIRLKSNDDSYNEYLINQAVLSHINVIIRYMFVFGLIIIALVSYILFRYENQEMKVLIAHGTNRIMMIKSILIDVVIVSLLCLVTTQIFIRDHGIVNKHQYLSYDYITDTSPLYYGVGDTVYYYEDTPNYYFISVLKEQTSKLITSKNKDIDYNYNDIVYFGDLEDFNGQYNITQQTKVIWVGIIILLVIVLNSFKIGFICNYNVMKRR